MFVRFAFVFPVLVLAAGVSRAQSSETGDTWLTQNYRFTGPPPAGEVRPTTPVLSELEEIQSTVLAILRKANFAGDYEAALAAAAQAAANAQLRGTLTNRQQPPQPGKTKLDEAPLQSPVYLIALKDHSIQAATQYWAHGTMLHYMTPSGAHEQVRPDLVDWSYSSELNHHPLEFHAGPNAGIARRTQPVSPRFEAR
jgi:hypothetical protein